MKNKLSESIMLNLKESGTLPTWCGIPGTIYRYHGDWNDSEVEAGMCLYNEWDVQDFIYEDLEERKKEDQDGIYEFEDWVSRNQEEVLEMIKQLVPVGGISVEFEQEIDRCNTPEAIKDKLEELKGREDCFIPNKVLDNAIEKVNSMLPQGYDKEKDQYNDEILDGIDDYIGEVISLVDEQVKSGEYL